MRNISGAFLLCMALLFAASAVRAEVVEVQKLLQAEEPGLWQMDSEDIFTLFPQKKLFFWNDSDKTTLLFSFRNKQQQMTFAGFKVYNASLIFKDFNLSRIYISFYNRSDAGDLDSKTFDETLKNIEQAVTKIANGKSGSPSTIPLSVAKKIHVKSYYCDDFYLKLEWSFMENASAYQAEFITLTILPPDQNESVRVNASLTTYDLKSRVKANDDGDRFLEIPATTQRAQWSVAATAERVMRYYGASINQNILIELINSNQGDGLTKMRKAIKQTTDLLKIKYNSLYKNQDISKNVKFLKMVETYNAEAARIKADKIDLAQYSSQKGKKISYDKKAMLLAMTPELFKATRSREIIGFLQFKRDVVNNINAGIPLIWATLTNVFPIPDKPRKGIGYHVRLITGYNIKENAVIYSDSWGPRDKRKMSWEEAWAISMDISTYTPILDWKPQVDNPS
ncbi:MAG: cysteine peptidase family C39 domain-containing protein [Victivallaceae bacterium]